MASFTCPKRIWDLSIIIPLYSVYDWDLRAFLRNIKDWERNPKWKPQFFLQIQSGRGNLKGNETPVAGFMAIGWRTTLPTGLIDPTSVGTEADPILKRT